MDEIIYFNNLVNNLRFFFFNQLSKLHVKKLANLGMKTLLPLLQKEYNERLLRVGDWSEEHEEKFE